MKTWLLLIYKVPNEPSARRVYVWRKLKNLGAVLLHDAAWVLPATPQTREKLQWLATEIQAMDGGEALLWEAQQVFTEQDARIMAHFTESVDAVYREILVALEHAEADLAALSKQYQQVKQQDYFHSALGDQARAALLAKREVDD